MTRDIKEKPAPRVTETGWAKARRLRDRKVRTCVAAVADETAVPPAARTGAEWNIVKGED
ncbi:hypothetical protein Sipo8835_41280 [Streptomyces ipomoeae]|uniref:Uncharacterized protein n=2 Tax=Streptomyces ipomoeae TaxID=103232 RepID=L1KWZ6_9ACTN|nr:hypothetical protein [Streptomyces ipomoeae]EKX65089.1 hypothetical protein STRIP9103_01017 [Streptomyces ipomoeae 91-03]MDX2692613.1 hypothetical protein [Streptomyces ipomoeae]MDX2827514.1 hypothetical protein [Streptomyces ipomoeae]MDX2837538.1 hypothetical protein [Streptomyces ipomoeae]MDX2934889.1 hypothetical protein [Streptomyces ipomoeae]